MNKVYLNAEGEVFINSIQIKEVLSVSSKTDWVGTKIVIELSGEFKSEFISEFQSEVKRHSLRQKIQPRR